MAVNAVSLSRIPDAKSAAPTGAAWLIASTQNGTHFPAAPIGLYFARLWYWERLYPVIWTLHALEAVHSQSDCTGA